MDSYDINSNNLVLVYSYIFNDMCSKSWQGNVSPSNDSFTVSCLSSLQAHTVVASTH